MDDRRLTRDIIDRICSHVSKGLTPQQACALEGIAWTEFQKACSGERPTNPEWKTLVDASGADAVRDVLAKIEQFGADKNAAGVKAMEAKLHGLDQRFRKERAVGGAGLNVVIYVGEPPAEPEMLEAEAVSVGQIQVGASDGKEAGLEVDGKGVQ
jgi:hypothetical protein